MAIVKKGSMLEGLRGRVGDLIFREVGGRTVVSRRPTQRREDVRSPERQRALTRFQQAVSFAREARHRQAFRSLARVLRARSPYHVALQDFLSEPVIEGIDDGDVGPRGGELTIRVSERIAVRSVRVKMPGRVVRHGTGEPPTAGPFGTDPGGSDSSEPAASARGGSPERSHDPIPAAVFFRRVERPAPGKIDAGDRRTPPGPGSPPRPEPPPPSGSELSPTGETAEIQPIELHATRRLGIQRRTSADRGRSTKEAHMEVWRVTLPRPGQVEVIAADYAGNRVRAAFRVGLPGGEAE